MNFDILIVILWDTFGFTLWC